MKMCCEKMEYFLNLENPNEMDPDVLICYSPCYDEYGIIIHDGGTSCVKIHYCPWCGMKLPDSKRSQWFSELEKLGIDDPIEQKIPEKYYSDKWWRELDL